ncbi:MMPL family transporter [Nanchangia anserum]|uniref:MMPL family transporter n=1 Tax=Nanchangia anserum TaxID=2692125 RepID=A0A8I0KSD1_9ACTO|nr:MMPL family transporter [Nanchangia anserum]MBD3690262.1 MMPL family transporter [Nanchangia anserum]QOX82301.1 MMPL family transporter [Nanchangia anserum]
MYRALARHVARYPKRIIAGWMLLVVVTASIALWGFGTPLFDRLHSDLPQAQTSQSYRGNAIMESEQASSYSIVAGLDHLDLGDDPARAREMRARAAAGGAGAAAPPAGAFPRLQALDDALGPQLDRIAHMDGVSQVASVFHPTLAALDPATDELVNDAGTHAAIIVTVNADDGGGVIGARGKARIDAVEKALDDLQPRLRDVVGDDASVSVTHARLLESTSIAELKRDLVVSESIGIPVSIIILVLVFGGVLAALMPAAGAIVAISTALAVMLGMTYIGEQQSFAVNVISVLGLGLSIDYGLLILSRYREELRADASGTALVLPGIAPARQRYVRPLEATLASAGRTVLFSAITVAVSILGMLVFEPNLLRSLGVAGVSVVVLAAACALTLVPALAFLASARLARPSRWRLLRLVGPQLEGQRDPARSPWYRLGRTVNRHPWPFLLVSVIVLLTCVIPVGHLQLRNSMLELLSASNPQRITLEKFSDVEAMATTPITIVARADDPDEVRAWGEDIATWDHVRQVSEPRPIGDGYRYMRVSLTDDDRGSPEAEQLVTRIREHVPKGMTVYVTGQAAQQHDFVAALARGLPGCLAIIMGATLILLFAMTRSIIVPIKALVINSLSLVAALGICTWVFQDGHGVALLGAPQLGGLESYVVVMMLCIGFGLSMDYEVFLLARMRETYVITGDNDRAVVTGVFHSGRIITSAAGILVCVFLAFCTSSMIALKQVGFVMAVAVVLDATIVRLCLVPSLMTLFGALNWWAPRWLHRTSPHETALRGEEWDTVSHDAEGTSRVHRG